LKVGVATAETALRKPANERLETLGDAWLKMYMSLVVMQVRVRAITSAALYWI
jgi:dsRNA-specific ribonuclease